MSDIEVPPVVLDCGSSTCKVGFAGDDAPRDVFPTIVCRRIRDSVMVGVGIQETFVGEEAYIKRGSLRVGYPMERGLVTNWDDMEAVWHHAFFVDLRVAPEDRPTLLTEQPHNPKTNREKAMQVMFETFGVPAFFLASAPTLSLYASGRTTGMVLESGDGVTHAVPVYEGCALQQFAQRIDVAGRDLTDHMLGILQERGCAFATADERGPRVPTPGKREIVRAIREQVGYIAVDFNAEMGVAAASSAQLGVAAASSGSLAAVYTLPDGATIAVGIERFRCPEALFRPQLLGESFHSMRGVHELVFDAVRASPAELQPTLFRNVVCGGGGTMLRGFPDRLERELRCLQSSALLAALSSRDSRLFALCADVRRELGAFVAGLHSFQCASVAPGEPMRPSLVKVAAPPERNVSAWIGGSILATLSTFQHAWIAKHEYDEHGARMVHRKCF